MTVTATKPYAGVPRDRAEGFGDKQLVYASWDQHLLFAAPFMMSVPPDMRFGDFVHGPLSTLIAADPDAASVDWEAVEWRLGNQPWQPDFARSLADNGVRHKMEIRFHTPGLNTLCAPR
ncbi:phenol hydroxylase [Nitrogeniibacter mangrovi]|uniref:Phenol hydroxylase n=1 Tax=Nitrogeniibacter mangrovi TaxID=2016596 RepID=A0A6C1B2F3_9RHOO|nr:phenol hydroxylase subunit P4 [Nitrogeniibacter mangrovi]QID16384.1 phenol hydroxylase [Nitrogeniibacter mangrovi]